MPALNVEFTDDELELLRERAAKRHVSMKTLVHDFVIQVADDDAMVDSAAHVIAISRDLLDRLAQQ